MKLKNNIICMVLTLSLFASGCSTIGKTTSAGWNNTKSFSKSCWSNTKGFFDATWDKAVEVDEWIKDHMW